MTDKEIIEGLINKDSQITEDFFFKQCKPLLSNIIYEVFNNDAEYDELVNELYIYLMKDNAAKLKSFQYRSSLFHWLKILAIRFFIRQKNHGIVIENEELEPLSKLKNSITNEVNIDNNDLADLKRLLDEMPNKRYALVIQRLIIDGVPPEELALEMGIRTSNIYNIKQRAIKQLTEVALKDIQQYGKA